MGVGLLAGSAPAASQSGTWTGGGSNDQWWNPQNWSGGIPAFDVNDYAAAEANFSAGPTTIDLNQNANASVLVFTSGGAWGLQASAGSVLTMTGGTINTNFGAPNADMAYTYQLYGGRPVIAVGPQAPASSATPPDDGTALTLAANLVASNDLIKLGSGTLIVADGTTITLQPPSPGGTPSTLLLTEGTLAFSSASFLNPDARIELGVTMPGGTPLTSFPDAADPILHYAGAGAAALGQVRTLYPDANATFKVDAGGRLALDRPIALPTGATPPAANPAYDSSTPFVLVKTGEGTLELSPLDDAIPAGGTPTYDPIANGFSGNLLVKSGELLVHSTAALGDGYNRAILDGATARLTVTDRLAASTDNLYRADGTRYNQYDLIPTAQDPGAGLDGGIAKARIFHIGPQGGTINVEAFSLQVNDGPLYATQHQLQGTGTLTKAGPGALLLGNPTDDWTLPQYQADPAVFSGSLSVQEGTVQLDSAHAAGGTWLFSGGVATTFNPSTISVGPGGSLASNVAADVPNPISLQGLLGSAGGDRVFSGAISLQAGVTFNSQDIGLKRVLRTETIAGNTAIHVVTPADDPTLKVDRTTTLSGLVGDGGVARQITVTGNAGNVSKGLALTNLSNSFTAGTTLTVTDGGVLMLATDGTTTAAGNATIVLDNTANTPGGFGPILGYLSDTSRTLSGALKPADPLVGSWGYFVGPATAGTTGGVITLTDDVTIADGRTFTVAGAGGYALKTTGAITAAGASAALNVVDATLDIAGPLSTSPSFTVRGNAAGTVRVSNAQPSYSFAGLTIDGATFLLPADKTLNPASLDFASNGTLKLASGAGTQAVVNLAGDQPFTGSGRIIADAADIAAVNLNGARTLDVEAGATVTIGARIGNGSLTKAGAGRLVLTQPNDHATTTISGGVLQADTSAALGAGDIILGGGVLQLGSPAAQLTYVDAIDGLHPENGAANTYNAATDSTTDWIGDVSGDSKWRYRSASQGSGPGFVSYGGSAYMGEEDADPVLYTQVTGLVPNASYGGLRLYFVDKPSTTWSITYSLNGGVTYDQVSRATPGAVALQASTTDALGTAQTGTPSDTDTRYYIELSGTLNADATGTMRLYIDDLAGTSTRSVYDGFAYDMLPIGYDPNLISRTTIALAGAESGVDVTSTRSGYVTKIGHLEFQNGATLNALGRSAGGSLAFGETRFTGAPAVTTIGGTGRLDLGAVGPADSTVGTFAVKDTVSVSWTGTINANNATLYGGEVKGTLNLTGGAISYQATGNAALIRSPLAIGGQDLAATVADSVYDPDLTLTDVTLDSGRKLQKLGDGTLALTRGAGAARVPAADVDAGALSVYGANPLGAAAGAASTINLANGTSLNLGATILGASGLSEVAYAGFLSGLENETSLDTVEARIAALGTPRASRTLSGILDYPTGSDDNNDNFFGAGTDNFTGVWTGTLKLDGGDYTFRLGGNDNAILFIDGQRVLATASADNAGLGRVTTTVPLTAGLHEIFMAMSTGQSGEQGVDLRWQPPGGALDFFKGADAMLYTMEAASGMDYVDVNVAGTATLNAPGTTALNALTLPSTGLLTVTGEGKATFKTTSITGLSAGADIVFGPGGLIDGPGNVDLGTVNFPASVNSLAKTSAGDVNFQSSLTVAGGQISIAGGSLGGAGSTITLQGASRLVTYTGAGARAASILSSINFGTASAAFDVTDGPGDLDLTVGPVTGANLAKTGAGTLRIDGKVTLTGTNHQVQGGKVALRNLGVGSSANQIAAGSVFTVSTGASLSVAADARTQPIGDADIVLQGGTFEVSGVLGAATPEWTYVDAIDGSLHPNKADANTYSAATDLTTGWATTSSSASAGLWRFRTDGPGTMSYGGNAYMGVEDSDPVLYTTVTGLMPGARYSDLRLYFVDQPSSSWQIRYSLDGGATYSQVGRSTQGAVALRDENNNPLGTPDPNPSSDTRYYIPMPGWLTADATGTIRLYIDDQAGSTRSVYDGFAYNSVPLPDPELNYSASNVLLTGDSTMRITGGDFPTARFGNLTIDGASGPPTMRVTGGNGATGLRFVQTSFASPSLDAAFNVSTGLVANLGAIDPAKNAVAALRKAGPGELTFAGTIQAGNVTVEGGRLNGNVIQMAGANPTISGGSATSGVVGATVSIGGSATTIQVDGAINELVIEGAILGDAGGTIVKEGTGRVVLKGANDAGGYGGGTKLNNGTIVLAGGNSLGSGALEMQSGTTLAFGYRAITPGLINEFWDNGQPATDFNVTTPADFDAQWFGTRGDPILKRLTSEALDYPAGPDVNTANPGAFSIQGFGDADTYTVRWRGFINVPQDGTYTFESGSNDGSWIFIDGARVIDNHGNHSFRNVSGTATLTAGLHEFYGVFYDSTTDEGVEFRWDGPGLPGMQEITPDVLFHAAEGAGGVVPYTGGNDVRLLGSTATFDVSTLEPGTSSLMGDLTFTTSGASVTVRGEGSGDSGQALSFTSTKFEQPGYYSFSGSGRLRLGQIIMPQGAVTLDVGTSGAVTLDYNDTPSNLSNLTINALTTGARVAVLLGENDPIGGAVMNIGGGGALVIASESEAAAPLGTLPTFQGDAIIEHESPYADLVGGPGKTLNVGGSLTLIAHDPNGTLQIDAPVNIGANGYGNLTKQGPGTVILGGEAADLITVNGGASTTIDQGVLQLNAPFNSNASYSGPIDIKPGATLRFGTNNPLRADQAINHPAGATIDLNGFTWTRTSGTFTLGNDSEAGAILHMGNAGTGVLEVGALELKGARITGNGTVKLMGGSPTIANGYSGTSIIEAGIDLGGRQNVPVTLNDASEVDVELTLAGPISNGSYTVAGAYGANVTVALGGEDMGNASASFPAATKVLVTGAGGLGSGRVTLNGATVQIGNSVGGPGMAATYYNGSLAMADLTGAEQLREVEAMLAGLGAPLMQFVESAALDYPASGGDNDDAFHANAPTDNFTLKWEGVLDVAAAETRFFNVRGNDAVALFVDGQRIASIASREDGLVEDVNSLTNSVLLSPGRHKLTVVFTEGASQQGVEVRWGADATIANMTMFDSTLARALIATGAAPAFNENANAHIVLAAPSPFDLTGAPGSLYRIGSLEFPAGQALQVDGAGAVLQFTATTMTGANPGVDNLAIAGTGGIDLGAFNGSFDAVNLTAGSLAWNGTVQAKRFSASGPTAAARTVTGGTLSLKGSTGTAAVLSVEGAGLALDAAVQAASALDIQVDAGLHLDLAEVAAAGQAVRMMAGPAGSGTVALSRIDAGALSILNTTAVALKNGPAATRSVVDSLVLDPGAKLEIGRNALAITSGNLAAIEGLAAGGVLTSADDAPADLFALAVIDSDGAAGNEVLAKFTYAGDQDGNGIVDGSDYLVMDRNYLVAGQPGYVPMYATGDINRSGVFDGDDYFAIDSSFLGQGAALPAGSLGNAAVPEPGTLAMLAVGALGLLARRRRA